MSNQQTSNCHSLLHLATHSTWLLLAVGGSAGGCRQSKVPEAERTVVPSAAADSAAIVLDQPDAVFPGTFTQITSMTELGSALVLAVDGPENEVQLLNFSSGDATPVGRVGQGPKEYTRVGGTFALPGGGALLNDPLEWRFLVLDSAGNIVATVPHPGRDGTDNQRAPIAGQGTADDSGHVYFEGSSFPNLVANGLSVSADSLAILRLRRATNSVDSVAWLQIPKMQVRTQSDADGKSMVAISRSEEKVFAAAEAWGVAGDGWVARVTPEPYRVIWYPPNRGAPILGPAQPYVPVPVTDADRQAVVDRLSSRRGSISVSSSGAQENKGTESFPPPEFTETKPPFLAQRGIVRAPRVLVSPVGEVWVPRSRPAGEKSLRYDVFNRSGNVGRRVRLPAGRSVVGFGRGVVYLIHTNEDDLQRVERYRLPD